MAERFQVASKAGRVMAEMLCFIVCYAKMGMPGCGVASQCGMVIYQRSTLLFAV